MKRTGSEKGLSSTEWRTKNWPAVS